MTKKNMETFIFTIHIKILNRKMEVITNGIIR